MLRTPTIQAGLVAVVLLLAANHAVGKTIGSVEITNADVRRFETLAVEIGETVERGFVKMMRPPNGKSFLVVWLDLKVTPGKNEDGDDVTNIEADDISLVDEAGKAYSVIGNCTRDGRFTTSASGFYLLGKPDTPAQPFSLVFAPPENTTGFTIKMASAEFKLAAAAKVESTIDRAEIASFKIGGVEVIDKLERIVDLGSFDNPQGEFKEVVRSTASKYLVVNLVAVPKHSNEGQSFVFSTRDIGVLYGAQVYLAPMGYWEYGDFRIGNNSYFSEKNAAGNYSTIHAKLVFPLPGTITKFRLLYLARTIAETDVPQ